MRVRARSLIAAVLLAVALSACSVDATVTVRMRDDGSGVVQVRVELDRAAVERAEVADGRLAERIRLDDLPRAGWRVSRWVRTRAGGAVVVASKPFSRPGLLDAIIEELSGPNGPLRDFAASRSASTFETEWKVTGTVDLRALKPGVTDDAELVANLVGQRVDPAAVELRLAGELPALTVRGRAELPDGTIRTVTATAGREARVAATATELDGSRVLLLVGGIAGVLVAAVVFVVGERSTRRRRDARPSRIPRRDT